MYSPALQAAGHDGAMKSTDGLLFIKPNTKRAEYEVYQKLQEDDDLMDITWACMGTLTKQQLSPGTQSIVEEAQNAGKDQNLGKLVELGQTLQQMGDCEEKKAGGDSERVTMVLENAQYMMKAPSILDVKLGSKLWDDDASEEKRERLEQVSRTTTSGSMSMRLAGMQVWDGCGYQQYDKVYGREIGNNEVVEKFGKFFAPSFDLDIKQAVCANVVQQLEYMIGVLSQKELRLISSSVLIVYESDRDNFLKNNELVNSHEESDDDDDDDDDDEIRPEIVCNVKLIDFAHTRFVPGQGPDKDVLVGLENLTNVFRQLEKQAT